MKRLFLIALVLVLAAGCGKKQVTVAKSVPPPPAASSAPPRRVQNHAQAGACAGCSRGCVFTRRQHQRTVRIRELVWASLPRTQNRQRGSLRHV